MECLIDGEFFVAEDIPVPALDIQLFALSGGANDDDHMWHTFEQLRRVNEVPDGSQIWGTTSAFLDACRACGWPSRLS
jgi:hypothetical protein